MKLTDPRLARPPTRPRSLLSDLIQEPRRLPTAPGEVVVASSSETRAQSASDRERSLQRMAELKVCWEREQAKARARSEKKTIGKGRSVRRLGRPREEKSEEKQMLDRGEE